MKGVTQWLGTWTWWDFTWKMPGDWKWSLMGSLSMEGAQLVVGHHAGQCSSGRWQRRRGVIDFGQFRLWPISISASCRSRIVRSRIGRSRASSRRRVAQQDGVASEADRLCKVSTNPELAGPHRRAHLVVLALEVGRRWSCETQAFITELARAKARNETQLMRRRVEQAWRLRWGSILACVAAWAVASTMLELPGARGSDGDTPPSQDVEQEWRFAGLVG